MLLWNIKITKNDKLHIWMTLQNIKIMKFIRSYLKKGHVDRYICECMPDSINTYGTTSSE